MHLSGNAANVCVFGWPKVHLRVAPQKEWNEDNAVVGLARVLLLHYCITYCITELYPKNQKKLNPGKSLGARAGPKR